MSPPPWLRAVEDGVEIRVRVQPRAKKSAVAGEHGQALKVRLAAPPVDGKANKALCAFMARRLGLARGAVRILSGERSREKRLLLLGADPAAVAARLLEPRSCPPGPA